ncbi:MAG: HU family DNA-binding protein [Patescibacteria group bacterium]
MDKKGLAELVTAKTNGTKKDSLELIDMIFDSIQKAMVSGDQVKVAGFGVFKVMKRAAREGINPKTGEKIHINAKTAPKFRAAKQLKEAVL